MVAVSIHVLCDHQSGSANGVVMFGCLESAITITKQDRDVTGDIVCDGKIRMAVFIEVSHGH